VRELVGDASFLAVGIFVNATADELNETAEVAGLDLLQLHGNHDTAIGARLSRPYVVAFHPPPATSVSGVEPMIAAIATSPRPPIAYHIDGYQAGQLGGQGIRADWSLASELARRWPIVLAGGLSADNVGDAIRAVAPMAVDVSSGVETDGTKDAAKIKAFVRAARRGFSNLTSRSEGI
jgi:phosphoribosylanthranilate isomerase